jgi:hypothetical protein
MKAVSNLAIIENPQFVKSVEKPNLGGMVSLYEDGSIFNEKTGQFYAPEKDEAGDRDEWQMRQDFDRRKCIEPGERYAASHRERSYSMRRYGLVA